MNDRDESGQAKTAKMSAGLCDTCSHAVAFASDRGTRFIRCRLAETDPAFLRFPRLPMLACRGYEQIS
jgi:hypothetical protein